MVANTSPIYTLTPQESWVKLSGVDSSTDGTDADVGLAMTAGSNGSYVHKLVCTPRSTSGSTTTSAASLRVYINNGSTVGTGTNNVLYSEANLPATAVDTAATSPINSVVVPLGFQLKAGYKIYVGATAMAANTNWDVTAIFGDY